jgi:OOP family OmpA-OmpF porin
MTALVPGFSVEVKGSYNGNLLIAGSVIFHGSDLKTAQDIQAGPAPTAQQVQQNQQQIEQSQQEIQAQKQLIQAQQQASGGAAGDGRARSGDCSQPGGHCEEQGGYSGSEQALRRTRRLQHPGRGNGPVRERQGRGRPAVRRAIAQAGSTGPGHHRLHHSSERVCVEGRQCGSQPEVSTERADNVTNFLEHQGKIPLTNMLAPGAMGTSRQVAPDTSAEGQAENRRVVVKILQIRVSLVT